MFYHAFAPRIDSISVEGIFMKEEEYNSNIASFMVVKESRGPVISLNFYKF